MLHDVVQRKKFYTLVLQKCLTRSIKLREITDNYTVPGDVCESYEAVYNMLAELDKAYEAYK